MKTPGTAAELERRRRLALSHLHKGHSISDVAEFLGVTERAVQLWRAADAHPHRPWPTENEVAEMTINSGAEITTPFMTAAFAHYPGSLAG